MEKIIRWIKRRKAEHIKERDPDGFYTCPVQDQLSLGIAPKGEWLGTEAERQEAIADKKFMDEHIRCQFCSFCDDLLKKLSK